KPAWVAVIAVTFIAGALAWLIVRRPLRDQGRAVRVGLDDWAGPVDAGPAETGPADTGPADTGPADTGPGGQAAWLRARGAPARPAGPDDDPEFLRALGAAIRRNPPVS